MEIFLTFLHVVAAIFMVVVVLLQQGKGADIGSAFGAGSSQTVFGSRGAGNFLTKLTTGFVVIFMGTSIGLTYVSAPPSLLDDLEPVPAETPAPVEGTPIPAPAAPADGAAPSGFEVVPNQPAPAPGSGDATAPGTPAPAPGAAATPPADAAPGAPAQPSGAAPSGSGQSAPSGSDDTAAPAPAAGEPAAPSAPTPPATPR